MAGYLKPPHGVLVERRQRRAPLVVENAVATHDGLRPLRFAGQCGGGPVCMGVHA